MTWLPVWESRIEDRSGLERCAGRRLQLLVTGMGVENSRKLFMWIPSGQYEFCPEGKIDNTHLNIYMVDV